MPTSFYESISKKIKNKNSHLYVFCKFLASIARIPEIIRFRRDAKEAIIKLNECLNEMGIDYWLEFGTLLGAIRENDFINHDLDIDVGLFMSDHSPKIEKKLSEAGFTRKLTITFESNEPGLQEKYLYNKHVKVDFSYFVIKKKEKTFFLETIIKTSEGWAKVYFPHFKKLTKIDFMGKLFPVPNNYDEHLKYHYGDDYMKKNKNWTTSMSGNLLLIDESKLKRIFTKPQ